MSATGDVSAASGNKDAMATSAGLGAATLDTGAAINSAENGNVNEAVSESSSGV